jgi:hypothetical protein
LFGNAFPGPALAGDRVLWARPREYGYDVLTQPLDGSTARHDRVAVEPAGPSTISLSASPRRFGLSIAVTRATYSSCKACDYVTVFNEFLTGRVGKPPQIVRRCVRRRGCGPTAGCSRVDTDVSEDVVVNTLCFKTITVRDYGAADPPLIRRYDGCGGAIAGDLLTFNAPGVRAGREDGGRELADRSEHLRDEAGCEHLRPTT